MIEIKNLICNYHFVLEKDGEEFTHSDLISFGPTKDKIDDFVDTPSSFIRQILDLYDYDVIKSISVYITKEV